MHPLDFGINRGLYELLLETTSVIIQSTDQDQPGHLGMKGVSVKNQIMEIPLILRASWLGPELHTQMVRRVTDKVLGHKKERNIKSRVLDHQKEYNIKNSTTT